MGALDTINNLPSTVQDLLGQASAAPRTPAPAPSGFLNNPFVAGVGIGGRGIASGLLNLGAAGAQVVGAQGVHDTLDSGAKYLDQVSAQTRPDIDQNGFFGNGVGGFIAKSAKTAGELAPYLLGGEALGGALGGAKLAGAAAKLPSFLGGGLDLATEEGAAGAAKLAKNITGIAALTYPQAFGSEYQKAEEQPGGASTGDILRAAAQAVPVTAAQSIVPGGTLADVTSLTSHFAGQAAIRASKSAALNAGAGAIGAGLQTAATDSFDPTLDVGQRAKSITDSALEGALSGGLIGGVVGLLPHGPGDTNHGTQTATADIKAATDFLVPQNDQLGGTQTPDLPQPQRLLNSEAPAALGSTTAPDLSAGYGEGKLSPFPVTTNLKDTLFDLRRQAMDAPVGEQLGFDAQPPADLGQRGVEPGASAKVDKDRYTSALEDADAERKRIEAAQRDIPAINAEGLSPDVEAQLNELNGSTPPSAEERRQAIIDRQSPPSQIEDAPPSQFDRTPYEPGQEQTDVPTSAVRSLVDTTVANRKVKDDLFAEHGDSDGKIASSGAMRDFINKSDATSPGALWNALSNEIAEKSKVSKSAGFKLVARNLGLLDEQNRPRNLEAEVAAHDATGLPPDPKLLAAVAAKDEAAHINDQVGPQKSFQDQATENRRNAETDAQEAAYLTGPRHSDLSISDITKLQGDRLNDALRDGQPSNDNAAQQAPSTLQASRISSDDPRFLPGYDDAAGPDRSLTLAQQSDNAARARDRSRLAALFPDRPGVERRGVEPQSISDRVMQAAHELTGGTGGEASIADLRAKLPDVAPRDFENALRDLHEDPTNTTLTKAPAGQRADKDGVHVVGNGRFHNLSIDAVTRDRQPQFVDEAHSDDFPDYGITYKIGKEGAAHIRNSYASDDLRGQGKGLSMYKQFIDGMHGNGRDVTSDTAVSPSAAKIYPKLKAAGYDVVENPNVRKTPDGGVTSNDGKPAFTVRRPDDRVQERGAAAPDARDQSRSGAADGGADTGRSDVAGASAATREADRQARPADVQYTPRRAGQSIAEHVADGVRAAGRPEREAAFIGRLEQAFQEQRVARFDGKLGDVNAMYDRDAAIIRDGDLPASKEGTVYNQTDMSSLQSLIADMKSKRDAPVRQYDAPKFAAVDRYRVPNAKEALKPIDWARYDPDAGGSELKAMRVEPHPRADEMRERGFNPDIAIFKGMHSEFEGTGFLDPALKGSERGQFVTDTPAVSNAYASHSNLVPMSIRADKAFAVDWRDYVGSNEKSYDGDAMHRLINEARRQGADVIAVHGIRDEPQEPVAGVDTSKTHTQYVVLKPELIRARHANFDPAHEASPDILKQDNKGTIQIRPGQRDVISLLRNADASTALHEFGHRWLNQLAHDAAHPLATDGIKSDFDLVKKYVGAKDGNFTTAQHEKFARATENYLRTGKSPNRALGDVFSQFREWLTGIYKTARELRAPLSEEIKGVFDRMFGIDVTPGETAMNAEAGVSDGQRPFSDLGRPVRQDASGTQPEPVQTPSGTQLPKEAAGATVREAVATDTPSQPIRPTRRQTRASEAESSQPVGDVVANRQTFGDAIKSFAPSVRSNLHYVDDAEGLPEKAYLGALDSGLDPHNINGLYHDGSVYLIGNMLRDATAVQEVLSHEVVGHLATQMRMNSADGLGHIFDLAGGTAGIEKIARKLKVWDQSGEATAGLKDYITDATDPQSKSSMIDELTALATASTIPRLQKAALTFVGEFKAALSNVLRKAGLGDFADRVLGFGPADVMKWLKDNRNALADREVEQPDKLDLNTILQQRGEAPVRASKARTVEESSDVASRVAQLSGSVLDRFDSLPLRETTRQGGKLFAQLRSSQGQVRAFKRDLPELVSHYDLRHQEKAIESAEHLVRGAHNQDVADFGSRYPKQAEALQRLEALSTEMNVDAFRPFSEHTWHDPKSANYENVRAAHSEVVQLKNILSQRNAEGAPVGKGIDLYNKDVALSRGDNHAQMTLTMQKLARSLGIDGKVEGFGNDPAVDFVNRNDLHNDQAGRAKFYKDAFDQRIAGLDKYIASAPKEIDTSALKSMRDMYAKADASMSQGPYFRLGREGNQVYSFYIKPMDDGRPNPASLEAIQKTMRAQGFDGYSLHTLSDNAHVYVKLPDLDRAEQFHSMLNGVSEHLDPSKDRTKGPTVTNSGLTQRELPFLDKVMSQVREAHTNSPENVRNSILRETYQMLADTMQDNSVRSVLARRDNVQGYSTSMLKNNVTRGQITAKQLARLSTSDGLRDLENRMRARVETVKRDPNKTPADATKVQDMMDQYMDTMMSARSTPSSTFANNFRQATHTYAIAGSPGYAIQNLSQFPLLTFPTLARNHSYVRIASASLGALNDTRKVLTALVKAQSTHLTPDILKASGISAERQEMLQHLSNSGHIDTGTFAKALDPNEFTVKKWFGKTLSYANATGTLSEVAGRLAAAVAAHELHTSLPEGKAKDAFVKRYPTPTDYAQHIVQESMFDWGSVNTPKLFSAGGAFGQAGPVMFQFHQFSTKLAELVYHSAYTGFVDRAATAEEKSEARKFILAHSAAVIATSGLLGLPAAGWVAGAVTKTSSVWNNGEPYDVESHFRSFLASMFGKPVAEGLTKGLPRPLLNADLSDLGDHGLLPLSRLMEDKRTLKEAWPDYLMSMQGSGLSMAANIAAGFNDMANGRILTGLGRALPTGLRNIARAYKIGEDGHYVDSQGRAMNIPVSASNVIQQALGVKNAQLSNEQERSQASYALSEGRKNRSNVIMQNLAMALEKGDSDGVDRWRQAMRDYDTDPQNQGSPISPRFNGYYQSRLRATAFSKARGTPIGVRPTDQFAQKLLNYSSQ